MTKTTTKAANTYRVYFNVTVDHPELRDSTLPKVEAGRVIHSSLDRNNRNNALGLAKMLLSGHYDDRAEFISRVWIVNQQNGKRVLNINERSR